MKIQGKVTYLNLATGFWGIIDKAGNKWRPVAMPKDLQREGLDVEVTAEPAKEEVSIFMWGRPIKILEVG